MRRNYTAYAAPGYMQAHPQDLDYIVSLVKTKPMPLESYQRQLGAVMGHITGGTANRLNKISAPTLVIHGEEDPLVPFPNGKFLAENIRGAKLAAYSGVGHLPIIEVPERFNRDVIAFLAEG